MTLAHDALVFVKVCVSQTLFRRAYIYHQTGFPSLVFPGGGQDDTKNMLNPFSTEIMQGAWQSYS